MEATIYNQKGKESGTIQLPENIFGLNWNSDLVHQVVTSMRSNARAPIAHTKNRGDVRGGGKKPWQQKGTGRARHGSTRSPIWVGGGVAHGPRNEKDFSRKINRKMKAKALFTILSRKFKDQEVIFIDTLNMAAPKTKDAREILTSISKVKGFEMLLSKRNNSAYLALGEKNVPALKSFNNFSNLNVNEMRNINPVDIMNYKYLVIANPEQSLKFLTSKVGEVKEKGEKAAKKTVARKTASKK